MQKMKPKPLKHTRVGSLRNTNNNGNGNDNVNGWWSRAIRCGVQNDGKHSKSAIGAVNMKAKEQKSKILVEKKETIVNNWCYKMYLFCNVFLQNIIRYVANKITFIMLYLVFNFIQI